MKKRLKFGNAPSAYNTPVFLARRAAPLSSTVFLQIFRYGKHCNLIVLSMTPEEMRKRIKQANETDDYVLSALLYAVQIFDENYTEND